MKQTMHEKFSQFMHNIVAPSEWFKCRPTKSLPSVFGYRFNPGLNMATIRQAINETIERGWSPFIL